MAIWCEMRAVHKSHRCWVPDEPYVGRMGGSSFGILAHGPAPTLLRHCHKRSSMLQVRIICHYTPTRNSQGGTNSLCNATHYEHFSCCYRYSNRPTANCDRMTITAESDMKQKRGKTFHTRTTLTNEDELSIAAVLKINCSKFDSTKSDRQC